jgi:phage terminase small subunit
MPNPGKPAEVKRLLGSRAYDPAKEMEVQRIIAVPEPLRRLEEAGLELWNKTWEMQSTWLKPTDLNLLQMTCEQIDEREQLRIYVMDNMDAWHERAGLRQLEKEIQSNLIQLGFTPQSRQKLGIQEVKARSKLEELMARKAENVASTMADTNPETSA